VSIFLRVRFGTRFDLKADYSNSGREKSSKLSELYLVKIRDRPILYFALRPMEMKVSTAVSSRYCLHDLFWGSAIRFPRFRADRLLSGHFPC
jgi:hypothetical protein